MHLVAFLQDFKNQFKGYLNEGLFFVFINAGFKLKKSRLFNSYSIAGIPYNMA